MKNQITIREANSKPDTAAFWEQLHSYHERDIFPNPKDESLKHFLNDAEYRAQIEHVHNRPQDNCYYLFFQRNGQDIGFALPVIFTSEDGKCFIMEFCVYPEFRGNGTGRACAAALLDWAKARGARYAELNYGGDERRLRFWRSIGFVENGVDEWGEPLMLLPPAEAVPFTVELLNDPTDWQLLKLENGFKREIGEETLIKFQQKQLQQAVQEGELHSSWPSAAIVPWACAASLHTIRLFPARLRVYMKIFTLNPPSAARELHECWRGQHKTGAEKTASRV